MRVNIRDIQLNIERRYFQTEVSAPTLEDLYASLSVQIGEEYLIGTLEPDADPADFDERNWTVYFLAGEPGTYTYLQDDSDNDMVVETYEIVLFKKAWEGGWEKIVIYSCGSDGAEGESAFVYIAYASDDEGTDFTTTFNAALDYIAIIATTSPLTPVVADFTGLWKKYKGEDGTGGGGSSDDLEIPKTPTLDTTARGIKTKFIANEDQAFGDVCFINADGKAQIADATTIATATGVLMALGTILLDAEGDYLMYGFVRNDAWTWTVGEWVYLSRVGTTGNTLTQTNVAAELDAAEDEVIQVLGVANSATTMFFNPQLVLVEYKVSEE